MKIKLPKPRKNYFIKRVRSLFCVGANPTSVTNTAVDSKTEPCMMKGD
jgi:hypothetical protein